MLNAAPAHVDSEQRGERGTERNSVHAGAVRQSQFGRRRLRTCGLPI